MAFHIAWETLRKIAAINLVPSLSLPFVRVSQIEEAEKEMGVCELATVSIHLHRDFARLQEKKT